MTNFLSIGMKLMPKAFTGKFAEVNTKLLKAIDNQGIAYHYNLNGIKNGVAIFENPLKENFGTTTIRRFFGLDKNGKLVNLKDKAIYKSGKIPNDRRTFSGKWQYDYRTNEGTKRNTTSINGTLRTVEEIKDTSLRNYVAGYFYWLPSQRTKAMTVYDIPYGKYTKYINDVTGKRGSALIYGKLAKGKDGIHTLEKVKGNPFPWADMPLVYTYNPNLGGMLNGKDLEVMQNAIRNL